MSVFAAAGGFGLSQDVTYSLALYLPFRNPGPHWKRRGHRGEEEDTEEDMTKDMDDSSAGASMEEGSMSKNGTCCRHLRSDRMQGPTESN